MAQKIEWKKVEAHTPSTYRPSARWGHNCVLVDDEIVFFGGYADSHYMNDLWAFNTLTMRWKEVVATGDVPSRRSNFTMNYDSVTRRIIVFGGGGNNKQRFNNIFVLDWDDKHWTQLKTIQLEATPWERTYHCAQIFYPYLVVHGGEALCDLQDLWVFNFENNKWTPVKIAEGKVKPSARRFHSSARIGTVFYVIAGCHNNYHCLNDIYCLDMAPLLQTNCVNELAWKELKPTGCSFLTRWGQTSCALDGKLYIFGGRFSHDLNDLLLYNPQKNCIKSLKMGKNVPKARRRHSSCFVGSNLVVFGGFNGDYFNDVMYINVIEDSLTPKSLLKVRQQCHFEPYLDNESNYNLTLNFRGDKIYLFLAFIAPYFKNTSQTMSFLAQLAKVISTKKEGLQITKILYNGYGYIANTSFWTLIKKYKLNIYANQQEKFQEGRRLLQMKKGIEKGPFYRKINSLLNPIIQFDQTQFTEFLEDIRTPVYYGTNLTINKTQIFCVNLHLLAAKSSFFSNVLKRADYQLMLAPNMLLYFQIMLYYLSSGYVVVYEEFQLQEWEMLYHIADYFCIESLAQVCQVVLISKINSANLAKIEEIAQRNCLVSLMKHYCYQLIKKCGQLQLQATLQASTGLKQQCLRQALGRMKFDIVQQSLSKCQTSLDAPKKKSNKPAPFQKENYEVN